MPPKASAKKSGRKKAFKAVSKSSMLCKGGLVRYMFQNAAGQSRFCKEAAWKASKVKDLGQRRVQGCAGGRPKGSGKAKASPKPKASAKAKKSAKASPKAKASGRKPGRPLCSARSNKALLADAHAKGVKRVPAKPKSSYRKRLQAAACGSKAKRSPGRPRGSGKRKPGRPKGSGKKQ